MANNTVDNGILRGNSKTSHHDVEAMPGLTQVPTSVTLSADQFEKLYLSPMAKRQPALTKKLGNPTPLGVLILFGGLLLVLASILEFVIGNTFPSVVFGHLGSFCLAFGASMTPAFNSAAPYSPTTTDTVAGLHSPGFVTTFAFFFLFMAVLMFIYMICATRINMVFVGIFAGLILVFSLLAAAYWRLGLGDAITGNRLTVGAGASLFFASMLGFYLLTAQLLDSVGFPLSLPIGDLSRFWDCQKKQDDSEYLE